MANLDTTSKRRSGIGVSSPWRSLWPLPDGSLNQGDRQHIAFMYSGILAGAAAAVVPGGGIIEMGKLRDGMWMGLPTISPG